MATVSSILSDHLSLRLTCVDRVICQGYIDGLQCEGQVIRFLLHRGYPLPSPTGFRTIHERLIKEINGFAASKGLEIMRFDKGASKEQIARPLQDAAARAGTPGVVLIGKAQERMPGGWRGWINGGSKSHPHFTWRRQTLFVDNYYFYLWDDDFGPGFLKLAPFAPFPVWSWCNGHEWTKRQLEKKGIAFKALDNGLWQVDDPKAASSICASFSAGHLRSFLNRSMRLIPGVLKTADNAAGFSYEYSVRQMEISDTAVFDRPRAGRAFFDTAIKDHLDLGRPDKVRIVFDRRITSKTPSKFSTEIITKGVDPTIQIHYKTSKVKAYFKESRALRVETTINNPRDFDVRKTLCKDNWAELVRIGAETNARFLAALGEGAPPPPDVTTLESVVLPSLDADGLRAPGLRFGDPRVMALLAALAAFAHIVPGLTNAKLCELVGSLTERPYSARQASYDLRRLRRKGFIERLEGRNVYRVTGHGRAVATFLTKLAARVVVPTLTELEAPLSPPGNIPRPIAKAWRSWERELDHLIASSKLAA